MKTPKAPSSKMSTCFAVFNCHINHAQDKARKAFISKYGKPCYMKEVHPTVREGLMSIFNHKPNSFTTYFVAKIKHFVNEYAPKEVGDD